MKTVPWAKLSDHLSRFIPPDCVPPGTTYIRQPRNMNKETLESFLIHIINRQKTLPIEEVFYFSHWMNRNGEMCPAQYPQSKQDTLVNVGTKTPSKIRKKAVKAKKVLPTGTSNKIQAFQQLERTMPDSEILQNQLVEISHAEMASLISAGYPGVQPANGPASGPPVYMVPQLQASQLRSQQSIPPATPCLIAMSPHSDIDPSLLTRTPQAKSTVQPQSQLMHKSSATGDASANNSEKEVNLRRSNRIHKG